MNAGVLNMALFNDTFQHLPWKTSEAEVAIVELNPIEFCDQRDAATLEQNQQM